MLSVVGLGCVLAVVMSAQAGEGLQGKPPISYEALWKILRASLFVFSGLAIYQSFRSKKHAVLFYGLQVCGALLFATGVGLISTGWAPSDPSLRILWQLLQGGLAGIPMLIGFTMVFGQRGGNALIHFGVGLLMVGQFAFGDRQLEQKLVLVEGEATNVLRTLDAVELAVIDHSDPKVDRVISIPAARLIAAGYAKEPQDRIIEDARLPFALEVVEYFPNSALAQVDEQQKSQATAGQGTSFAAVLQPPSGGANGELDMASAYVRLLDPKTKTDLGVYLLSQHLSDFKLQARRSDLTDIYETVRIGERSYDVGLRFKQIPKDYWVKLTDVKRMNYSGSDTPRDYSSYIQMVSDRSGEERSERIWMNNPLRYQGETFYQSDYAPLADGKERTGIQVVANEGWMIPYVACMLVMLGLCVHFGGTLYRFVGRQERATQEESLWSVGRRMWPAALVVALLCGMMLVPRASGPKGFDFYRAGQIPVSFGGRVMPLDSLAQQTLVAVSNKSKLTLPERLRYKPSAEAEPGFLDRVKGWFSTKPSDVFGQLDPGERMTALQWFFEIASDMERVEEFPMFRIDADEVLTELNIQRRKDNRYSLSDLRPVAARFNELVQDAVELKRTTPEAVSFKQNKLIELDQRIRAYTLFAAAFQPMEIPAIPTEDQLRANSDAAFKTLSQLKAVADRTRSIEQMNGAALLPPVDNQATDERGNRLGWTILPTARLDVALQAITEEGEVSPALATFEKILNAYKDGDAKAFNLAVAAHLREVQKAEPADLHGDKLSVERWLQAVNPTDKAMFFYWVAVVLTFVGFMFGGRWIRPSVLGILCVLLLLHTAALVARIYVTGRPPVINLYSSAVFIGWAAAIGGIILELIFRTGIGNLVASISGASSLLVAYGLDSGDTMAVLQAVLDTQFWLSTHVITVTLGYMATFVAGLLGIIYLGLRVFSANKMSSANIKLGYDIYRMTYGVVCFGILFSFIGTVLGGLWADDSWGRFWGWDPKENGALLIVLWNALLLHARWDKLVGERGFALLAVAGNIVTAWSWFGTNQLGRGLHSYGFTSGVLLALILFAFSQLAIIFFGWLYTLPGTGNKTASS